MPPNLKNARFPFKILVYTLTATTFLSTLPSEIVRAEPNSVEQLNSTLSSAGYSGVGVPNAANYMTAPDPNLNTSIQNAYKTATGAIPNTIGEAFNLLNNPMGSINGIVQSILVPFEMQIQQYFQVLNNYFNQELQNILTGIFKDGSGGESGEGTHSSDHETDGSGHVLNTGALGIPDFPSAHAAIDDLVKGDLGSAPTQVQASDVFNTNPHPLAQSLKFEEDRVLNRGMAAAVISKEGQALAAQEIQSATQALQLIQAKAREAQGLDVTQDVLKNLTAIEANRSTLEAGSYSQLMGLRQQTAANSVVTANISESLDEFNRSRHAEAMAGALNVMHGASNLYLPGQKQ